MSKHTTGPWDAIVGKEDQAIAILPFTETESVALVKTRDWTRRQADAQLMAAAPDLLVACEALLVEFGEFDAGCPDRECSTCRLIRVCEAAIAKARGETQR